MAPWTGLSLASVTSTLGSVATALFTVAVWPVSALTVTLAAGPAVPVAVKVTGEPVRPAAVAVRVFAPAFLPRVQSVAAMPEESVVTTEELTPPPPEATSKVTEQPATGSPSLSVTTTAGRVGTAVPATAVCASPALREIVLATPGVVGVQLHVCWLSESVLYVSVHGEKVLNATCSSVKLSRSRYPASPTGYRS